MKFLPQMYLWTGKNCLNFGSHLLPNPDPEIFKSIFQHYKIDRVFFHYLAHISWKTDQIYTKILPQMRLWTWTSPLNFRSRPDADQIFLGRGLSGLVPTTSLPVMWRWCRVTLCWNHLWTNVTNGVLSVLIDLEYVPASETSEDSEGRERLVSDTSAKSEVSL